MATLGQAGEQEQTGCSFQVHKFQQLSTNQGLICIVSDVGVPKLVSGPHSRISVMRASWRHSEPKVSGRINKGSVSQGVHI